MKIATYNVGFLCENGIYERSGQCLTYPKELFAAHVKRVKKTISELDADALFLQGIGSKKALERIVAETGTDYLIFCAKPDADEIRNAVLYKRKDAVCKSVPTNASSLPVFAEEDYDTLGGRIASHRDFVHVETYCNRKRVHLIGIQLKADSPMSGRKKDGAPLPMGVQIDFADGLIRSEIFRLSQAKKVREVIDGILRRTPDARIIVLGDFDAEEDSPVCRIVRGAKESRPDPFVQVSQYVMKGEGFSVHKNGKKRLVDQVFMTRNLVPELYDARILSRGFFRIKNTAVPSLESEHAPFMIELRGPEKEESI